MVGRIIHRMFGEEYTAFFENVEQAKMFASENEHLDIVKIDEV